VQAESEPWKTSFFQGNFAKYSAYLGGHTYIIKVREDQAPELPDVEYISNKIARILGLPIPDFYLINFFRARAFVSRVFIKPGQTMDLKHIYHYLPKGQEQYNCETIINVILEETKRATDAETFVKMCLYDAFIGNNDRHGRNIAFIVTPKGTAMSPIYDNNSSLGLEHGEILNAQWNPSGRIATSERSEPGAREYVREFMRLGYTETVKKFVASISMEQCEIAINQGFCTPLMKTTMIRLLKSRHEELKDEVAKKT